jgi:catechol 2,3-dioxygenase-like lactoylglutathione lyase family enzyme
MHAKLESVQPVLMVHDVEASIRFYERLGFQLAFRDASSTAAYAGVRRDGVELHLQWHDAGDFGAGDRPTYRFVVSDVDALSREFSEYASELTRTQVIDTTWGTREFHVHDLDGNGLQFYRDR